MLTSRFTVSLGFCACSAFVLLWGSSYTAYAQGHAAGSSSASGSVSASACASISASISNGSSSAAIATTTRQVPFPPAPIYTTPGGLTADKAAEIALKTSIVAKVDEEKLKAAGALVDAAWANYFPRLGVMMRATRLSDLPSTSLGSLLVTSPSAAATVAPLSPVPSAAIVDGSFPIIPYNLSFPVPNQQYIFEVSLIVPLSDYVLRIYQAHQGALDAEEAAKWTLQVTKEGVATDARVYFYNLLRAHSAVNTARSAVDQTKAHLKDVKALLAVKRATNADVARVDYQIEAANLAVIQSENLVAVTEAYLRVLLHTDADAAITLGEDLDTELPLYSGQLKDLRAFAISNRPELKALDAQIRAMKRSENIAEASYYPQISGFAHFDYSNPAMRGFQSFSQTWAATWDFGVSLTWSPNDIMITKFQAQAVSGNLASLEMAREQASDLLAVDVTTAFTKVREAEASVAATRAQVTAAEESYRVAREQFLFGAATSAQLVDAESDLTRARLSSLNARADLRIALAQLKKATGQAI